MNIFKDGVSIQFCKNDFTECHILAVWMFTYYELILGLLLTAIFAFILRWYISKYRIDKLSVGESK